MKRKIVIFFLLMFLVGINKGFCLDLITTNEDGYYSGVCPVIDDSGQVGTFVYGHHENGRVGFFYFLAPGQLPDNDITNKPHGLVLNSKYLFYPVYIRKIYPKIENGSFDNRVVIVSEMLTSGSSSVACWGEYELGNDNLYNLVSGTEHDSADFGQSGFNQPVGSIIDAFGRLLITSVNSDGYILAAIDLSDYSVIWDTNVALSSLQLRGIYEDSVTNEIHVFGGRLNKCYDAKFSSSGVIDADYEQLRSFSLSTMIVGMVREADDLVSVYSSSTSDFRVWLVYINPVDGSQKSWTLTGLEHRASKVRINNSLIYAMGRTKSDTIYFNVGFGVMDLSGNVIYQDESDYGTEEPDNTLESWEGISPLSSGGFLLVGNYEIDFGDPFACYGVYLLEDSNDINILIPTYILMLLSEN